MGSKGSPPVDSGGPFPSVHRWFPTNHTYIILYWRTPEYPSVCVYIYIYVYVYILPTDGESRLFQLFRIFSSLRASLSLFLSISKTYHTSLRASHLFLFMLMIKLHTLPFGIGPPLIYSRAMEAQLENGGPWKKFTGEDRRMKKGNFFTQHFSDLFFFRLSAFWIRERERERVGIFLLWFDFRGMF